MPTLELEARVDSLLATAQAETAEIDLFAPIPEREECPICFVPLPLEDEDIMFYDCCGKEICCGCDYKHMLSEITINNIKKEGLNGVKCLCCCQEAPKNKVKALKRLMKKNNSEAFFIMATKHKNGEEVYASDGVFQSDTKSLEMFICAAELGHAEAFRNIGTYYHGGILVEENLSKALDLYEVSAKKGSVKSHKVLARFHERNGDIDECIKHLKVVAGAGFQKSMDDLLKLYKTKELTKEELTQTLRAFQVSRDLMTSKDRNDAYAFRAANQEERHQLLKNDIQLPIDNTSQY